MGQSLDAYIAFFYLLRVLPFVVGLVSSRLPIAMTLGAATGVLDAFAFRMMFGKTLAQQTDELTMTSTDVLVSDLILAVKGTALGATLAAIAFLLIKPPLARLRKQAQNIGADFDKKPNDGQDNQP